MPSGQLIRRIRKDKGLTQKELGERCGIAEPTIRSYELGKLNPKYETLQRIAAALGVPVESLLDSGNRNSLTATEFKIGDSFFDGKLSVTNIQKCDDGTIALTLSCDEHELPGLELLRILFQLKFTLEKLGVSADNMAQLNDQIAQLKAELSAPATETPPEAPDGPPEAK